MKAESLNASDRVEISSHNSRAGEHLGGELDSSRSIAMKVRRWRLSARVAKGLYSGSISNATMNSLIHFPSGDAMSCSR